MTTVPNTPVGGPDPLVGAILDRYRVLQKLGEGGMGSVYAVEHVMLQKRMAMKLLRAELSRNQDLVTRFQNEAIAASRIGQENIVAVTDFGRTPNGLVYFVMEELQGHSLADVIRAEGRVPLPRVLGIAAQVCRALSAAHASGIIHRDLKPENIVLVPREGQADFVKVLDFGISKMTERPNGERLTQQGMIVGTPEYMSPEQSSAEPVDARSDIYSLGVMIFEMLTGKLPFNGENALQLLMHHHTQPVPKLDDVAPGLNLPPTAEAFVLKALAKRPADRQQSMNECLTELQLCAGQLRMTMPAMQLPDMAGFTPTDPMRMVIPPSPLRIPSQPPPPIAAPATVLVAEPGGPELTPSAKHDTFPSRPTSSTDELTALALKPRRIGVWIGLAAVLACVVAGLFFLMKRQPSVPEPPPPVAAVTPPAPLPLAPPPVVPAAVVPAAVVPPPVVVAPLAPAPPVVEAAPSPTPRVNPPKQTVHRRHPTPVTVKPAAPRPAAEPYQKLDDLKTGY